MRMQMVSCALTMTVSSFYLHKTVDAFPVPPYTAFPIQATGSSTVAGVSHKVTRPTPSSSSSGSRLAIAIRDQLITDERPTPAISQAEQQQQQDVSSSVTGPEPTTWTQSALPQSVEVLAQIRPCDPMEAMTRTSLADDDAGGAAPTDGTGPPTGTTIMSYIVSPSSTTTGDAAAGVSPSIARRWMEKNNSAPSGFPHPGPPPSNNGVQAPPAVMLWMQCAFVAAEMFWIAVSNVWRQVSQRAGARTRNEQPDSQDGRPQGDTPRDGDDSMDKCSRSSSISLFKQKKKRWWLW